MKKIFCIVTALLCLATSVRAENKTDYLNRRQEVRIGWGDQLFESLMWHNTTYVTTTMPAGFQRTYRENFSHDQHLWAEYQWRFSHWFSLGGMLDVSDVRWEEVTRDGTGKELSRDPKHFFYNLVVMPTMRFTYFHHEHVNLYSGLGFGMDINGGTELGVNGKKTDVGMAFDLTYFGVSANYGRWFGAVDLGGLFALQNKDVIFMMSSRIINVSIGARF